MSKTKETLRTKDNATAISKAILQNKSFCNLYHITDANMNTAVETQNNKVTEIQEELSVAKEIIKSMRLDDFFLQAVKRIRVYIDSNAFVVFFGAVFTSQSALAKLEKSDKERLTELFNKSLDKKYNNRVLREHQIKADTETRHSFDNLNEFCEFIQLMQKAVMLRKEQLNSTTAQQTATQQNTAKQTAQQTKSKAKQSKAQQTATKIKKATAEQLAQLTKEVIESESKKA